MQIRIQHQDGREESLTLDASQTLRFGTRRSAEVVLQGAGIFPIHFGIVYYRDAFTVAASKQARKIRVNGARVRKAVLHDGDRIELGQIVITVVDEDSIGPVEDLSEDLLQVGVAQDTVPGRRATHRAGAPDDRATPPAFIRLVQSPWFTRVLVACVVLPLVALIGIYVGQLPTADERFRVADEAYRLEDFARAAENFDRFLSRHPRHALAHEARLKRDLARFINRFDRGSDAMTLIHEMRVVAEDWRGLELPADVQRGLSQILPPLVEDLVQLAQAATQRGANDTARDAGACAAEGLQMIYDLLPASLQRSGNVDQLQSALTRWQREVAQAAAVAAAVRQIDNAGETGDMAAAGAARQALLGDYPQLTNARQLVDAMRKVAASDAARAKLVGDLAQNTANETADEPWQVRVILAPGAVESVPATPPQPVGVTVRESGTIFGLDALSGQTLWRRAEMPHAVLTPDPDAPRDYLVADESMICVVSRDQHACLSAYYLGHEPGTIWVPPVVIQDYLLVSEQIGPQHTNVHVLHRGDELRPVQTLALPGVVTSTPVLLGEILYIPTDRGCVRMWHWQTAQGDRPFSDKGELDVSTGPPRHNAELQLATVQGKLWVAGRGVRIFEPAVAGTPPTLVQHVWDDLQVTQPLHVVDDIVVGAGRVTDHVGVEVRAWGLAAGKTLWSRNLAVPLQAPPLVRAQQGDVWLLSASEKVYRVPSDQLVQASESPVVVNPWHASQVAPSTPVVARGASVLCGETGVLGPTTTGDALWIVTAQGDACKAERTPLPRPLSAEPVVLGQRLLLPLRDGLLSLYDVQQRQTVSSTLLPGVSPSAPPAWQTPAVLSDREVVVTDGQAGVFLLRLRASQDGLEIVNQITVAPPLVSRLIAVSNTVWGVDSHRTLRALTVPDLTVAAGQQLSGAVVWGPQVVGAYGYVATDDGKLYCLGTAAQPQWVASLESSSVVGGCAIDAQHIALANASGAVWILDSATGQSRAGPIDAHSPLDAGPFLIGQRLAVVTRDGCVLVTRQTADVLLSGDGRTDWQSVQVLRALACVVLARTVQASAAEEVNRIIDGEPYDQLVLRAEGRVFKLVPIDLAKRAPLRDQDPDSNLVVRLFDRPQQKYQVQWKHIDRVELFEELVLGEVAELVAEKKYDDAHQYFLFLQARSPEFPGLATARQDCLLSEAKDFLDQKRHDQSLLILTELYEQNRDYPGLREAMGSAVNALVESHFAAGKVAAARELVEQLASRYADHEVVVTRRQELIGRAGGFLQAARAAMDQQQWREAHDAVQTALSVWPDLAEAQGVAAELNRRYPIVRVGVQDCGNSAELPGQIPAWAQLRQQRLTTRSLFELAALTAAGGENHTPLEAGKVEQQILTFTVNPDCVGPYRQIIGEGGDVRYQIRPHYFAVGQSQPREIIERKFDSTIDALRALDQRRILAFDRVSPWELATARAHANVTLVQYAAPTVHLLVPNPRSGLLTSGVIRRAMDAAIDRERILRDVLGSGTTPAGEVLSGPFPRGYAYDEQVAPAAHSPRTAIALFHCDLAGNTGDSQPRHVTLVHRRSDVARRAALAIQEDLALNGLGLQVDVREITPGDELPSASSWDLQYVEWQAMEPARDVGTLLGGTHWSRGADPELDAALDQLAQAASREHAAVPLHAIHRRVHETLAVIPLWQIDEYALVHPTLRGVGERPVTLYHNIEQWQVTSER